METWVLPAILGLGLAAATGLRTFLPLLILAVAGRFGLFGTTLNAHAAWLGSTPALVALGVATVIELAADKIPAVDNLLSMVGTVSRPIAGAVAAGAVFSQADPVTAAIAGLIIGAPTAFAFHSVQSGARFVSTTATAGLANPVISVVEDIAAIFVTILALAAPILAAITVIALLFGLLRLRGLFRPRQTVAAAAPPPPPDPAA